jgi:hypothetical protein
MPHSVMRGIVAWPEHRAQGVMVHAPILLASGDIEPRPTRDLHLEHFPPQGLGVLGSQVDIAACNEFSDDMR